MAIVFDGGVKERFLESWCLNIEKKLDWEGSFLSFPKRWKAWWRRDGGEAVRSSDDGDGVMQQWTPYGIQHSFLSTAC